MHDPLAELRAALALTEDGLGSTPLVHLDFNRERRTGVPEVVMAEGKDAGTVLGIIQVDLERSGRVILSRVRKKVIRLIEKEFAEARIETFPRAHMVTVKRPDYMPRRTGGRVGIITAGTSDAPMAEQARVMAEEMGCDVSMIYDVGVAGLHRLVAPLRRMLDDRVDVVVVAAGMDGALPSVVAGLVDVPVIGLPTSTGYGLGGRGVGALLSMLQTCAPGLMVVNVDNGINAGASAAKIANRIAVARGAHGAADSMRAERA